MKGARRFERYQRRLSIMAIGALLGGGVAFKLLTEATTNGFLIGAVLVLWLASSLFLATRLRGRHETLPAYKRRIGYRDPED